MPAKNGVPYTNRLSREHSPYLLQHAHNPVDWYPWGQEAFDKARRENKPLFLSVGYSTCHWCHVMERESFEDKETAGILNKYFVAIKVDREERPEVDEYYMAATQILTGRGGWPNSLWLTPAGEPWFAGTYFPPEDRAGRPGFKTVLRHTAALWREKPDEVRRVAAQLAASVRRYFTTRVGSNAAVSDGGQRSFSRAPLLEALKQLEEDFDPVVGGYAGRPKFPPHGSLELLLYEYRRTGETRRLRPVLTTLDGMAAGGLRDHLGGGFHRYSTDARWFLPHFEKMLYDNARLLSIYAEAYAATEEARFKRTAEEIAGWVLREMTDAGGGFYSALDADSEGEEGRYYLWTTKEVEEVLGAEEGKFFAAIYGLTATGNYHDEALGRASGRNLVYLPAPPEKTAAALGVKADGNKLRARLEADRRKLAAAREKRPRPARDDKISAAWNGLMIFGLARAGRLLKNKRFVGAAARAADFVLRKLLPAAGRSAAFYRGGVKSGTEAYLDDYVFTALGLLELYEADRDKRRPAQAAALMEIVRRDFSAPAGGFFLTSQKHQAVPLRFRNPLDDVVPSGNSVAVRVLVRLYLCTGKKEYLREAAAVLRAFRGFFENNAYRTAPRAGMLLALDEYLTAAPAVGEEEIAVESADDDGRGPRPDARSRRGPVTVEVFVSRTRVVPGETFRAAVRLKIAAGLHVNSAAPRSANLSPTAVEAAAGGVFSIAPPTYPPGKEKSFGTAGEKLSVYEGEALIRLTVKTSPVAAPGAHELKLVVRVQPCDDRRCLTPRVHELRVPVTVTTAEVSEEPRFPKLFPSAP